MRDAVKQCGYTDHDWLLLDAPARYLDGVCGGFRLGYGFNTGLIEHAIHAL